MPILSKRGREASTPKPTVPENIGVDIFIYTSPSDIPGLTKEERDNIETIFKDIRRQLDEICGAGT